MEAGKEFMKGKDVFVATLESPSATVVCHLCSTSYLHSGSTPMSIVVVVSPLRRRSCWIR